MCNCIVKMFVCLNVYCRLMVQIKLQVILKKTLCKSGLGSSTVDQVLKYTKYPKYIPSTSTGQVLIFLKYFST